MSNRIAPIAAGIRIALSEIYPDSTDGVVLALDEHDALEAIPAVLAAYVGAHQRQWL